MIISICISNTAMLWWCFCDSDIICKCCNLLTYLLNRGWIQCVTKLHHI